jgi:hypothetical protein
VSERPPIDADIRSIWQYLDAAEDAAFKDPDPARPLGKRIPTGRRTAPAGMFAARLQMTKAEKTAILADALERQIAQRDKDLAKAQRERTEDLEVRRRKGGLRPSSAAHAPEPWRRISEQLDSEWVSRDFRRVVALLIRVNVFSANGNLPSALDRDEAKRSHAIWCARLDAHFGDVAWEQRENLACRLVALDHLMDIDGLWETSQITDWGFYQSRVGYLAEKVHSTVGRDGGESKQSGKMRRLLFEVHRAEIIDAP